MRPNYQQLYTDIIAEKYPEKMQDETIKNKIENICNAIDILVINKMIFGVKQQETEIKNQQLRSYDENSIHMILDYQRKNNLSNNQLSIHFKLSRNTITKWKKIFLKIN